MNSTKETNEKRADEMTTNKEMTMNKEVMTNIRLLDYPPEDSSEEQDSKIVWLEDPRQWEYVRRHSVPCRTKKGSPINPKLLPNLHKLVGYEELDPSVKSKFPSGRTFIRNVFWLKDYDRGCPNELEDYHKDRRPTEAVSTADLEYGGDE